MDFKIYQMKVESEYCFKELSESILKGKTSKETLEMGIKKLIIKKFMEMELR